MDGSRSGQLRVSVNSAAARTYLTTKEQSSGQLCQGTATANLSKNDKTMVVWLAETIRRDAVTQTLSKNDNAKTLWPAESTRWGNFVTQLI